MKLRFLLAAFVFFSVHAWADPSPIKFSVGKSTHRVEPPESSIAGYESVDIPVRMTNLLIVPRWFDGVPFAPAYRVFTRGSDAEEWKEESMGYCGVGMTIQRIGAGASLTFKVSFPARKVGRQFFLRFPVYERPSPEAKSIQVSSEPATIE